MDFSRYIILTVFYFASKSVISTLREIRLVKFYLTLVNSFLSDSFLSVACLEMVEYIFYNFS